MHLSCLIHCETVVACKFVLVLSIVAMSGGNILSISFLNLRPCHTLPDNANGRVTDSKILCPFVSVRMRFLSVPRAVNAFRVR